MNKCKGAWSEEPDPEACFTVWPATDDRYVCIDDVVTFSAACTTDPDGCGLIWTWSFGKDAYDKSDGNSDWEHCKYSTPGDRQVTLRVAERPSEHNPCCREADTFARTVTVVEVASLLPDEGVEIDDGDGDPDTKSFVICIADSGVVTVTATPDPNISEEKLPGYGYSWGWELTGGDGDSLLFRTVDRTTAGVTTITCTCGSSSKETKIYVVKVDINAGLSEPNELDPGKYINVNWDDDDNDGWDPNDAPPGGTYTGDKSDANIVGGDSDFRSFSVSITPSGIPDGNVSVTFGGNVKVWETNTKKEAGGGSSEVSSGTQFPVEDLPKTLYLEGVSGSSTFRDVELKATYLPCDANDIVKITVFEVTLTGLFGFGGQQADNDKKHSSFQGSSDKNGRISWDDANGDGTKGDNDPNCEYFHNCMECQGTVKPSGVTTQVEFDIKRDRWAKSWKKLEGGGWNLIDNSTPWTDDDPVNGDEDLTPSANDHIYHIDGPGFGNKNRGPTWDYLAMIGDFREWVMIKIDGTWYQCSDYYKWHTKCYTKPKDATDMTRDSLILQQLGSGWITVPNSP